MVPAFTMAQPLTGAPDSLDLVINEILFDPLANGSDYLELYNRSRKAIDLNELLVGNRNSRGEISSLKRISEESRILLPGSYVVLTDDTLSLYRNYLVKDPLSLIQVSSLPSWPNTRGTAVLMDTVGRIIDELIYDAKWHFALLADPEGVSLERIDVNGPTQDPNNWHSAADQSGHGTPGYANSNMRLQHAVDGEVELHPEIFSPDGDGRDDFAQLDYSFAATGYVCSVTIFDSNGRQVRRLVRNAICGMRGSFTWDGLDEMDRVLPMGVYIVFIQAFNLQGKIRNYKRVITLARRW